MYAPSGTHRASAAVSRDLTESRIFRTHKKRTMRFAHNPFGASESRLDQVRLEDFKNSLSVVLCMDV